MHDLRAVEEKLTLEALRSRRLRTFKREWLLGSHLLGIEAASSGRRPLAVDQPSEKRGPVERPRTIPKPLPTESSQPP